MIQQFQCLMFLLDLSSCPLHTIQSYIFRHSLVISSPSFQQCFKVTHICWSQFCRLFVLRRTIQQFFKLIKWHAFSLYLLRLLGLRLLFYCLSDHFVDVGDGRVDFGLGSFSLDKCSFVPCFDAFRGVLWLLAHVNNNKRLCRLWLILY